MNKIKDIDFITFPTDSFLSSPDYISNHFEQLKLINDIASSSDLDQPIKDYVLGFMLFFYLRIGASAKDLGLVISQDLSPATLLKHGFFFDIFNRTQIICSQNDTLSAALKILRPHYWEAASALSDVAEDRIYTCITSFDWSNDAFRGVVHQLIEQDIIAGVEKRLTRVFPSAYQVVGLYVYDDLMGDMLVGTSFLDESCATNHYNNVQVDVCDPPSVGDKILCPSELYMRYLISLLEKSGWPAGAAGDAMFACFKDVHGYGTDQLLWALHVLALPLFGYKQALTVGLSIAKNLYEITETDFDFMTLPQLSNEDVPDVGPLALGSLRVDYANSLYCLSYCYGRLSQKGRMHVAVTPSRLEPERQVLAYLLDADEIEAVIQYGETDFYLVINRQKPVHKTGRVLLYYTSTGAIHSERFRNCFETFTCDPRETNQHEGALVLPASAIKHRNYLLVPKDYVFDYSTVINNAEFEVASHLSHNIAPRIASVASVIKHLNSFLYSRGLANEPLQDVFFEGQPQESVAAAISKAQQDVAHIAHLLQETRKIIATQLAPEDFENVDLVQFLRCELSAYVNPSFILDTSFPDSEITVLLHKTAFLEMLNNIMRNAEVHGFRKQEGNHRILINVENEKGKDVAIEILNNGAPFPNGFTKAEYLSFGRKRKDSPGDGLGGAFIDKVLRGHGWNLELVRDKHGLTAGVRINMPKGRDS